jgi:23S rRNA (cytidine1920-2'-O)/16S rRNA (cytidine1409-2'-O)-methyltransferase
MSSKANSKKRLDVLLVERGLCPSREKAQALILAGEVWSGETRLEKAGAQVAQDIALAIRSRGLPYVSRAGLKLEYALDTFKVPVDGRVCIDVGASTGGFTDCLLQRGARHVFAVDVGYGQLDSKLRADPRVSSVEKANARFLTTAELATHHPSATEISLACIDVSFISLHKVIEPLQNGLPSLRDWVLLFKPQFEVGREHVGKGGLVRDEAAVAEALESFHRFLEGRGLRRQGGPESSPLAGKKSGNVEILLFYVDGRSPILHA